MILSASRRRHVSMRRWRTCGHCWRRLGSSRMSASSWLPQTTSSFWVCGLCSAKGRRACHPRVSKLSWVNWSVCWPQGAGRCWATGLRKLYGVLSFISAVVPWGRAHISPLWQGLATVRGELHHCNVSASMIRACTWWRDVLLGTAFTVTPFRPWVEARPAPLRSHWCAMRRQHGVGLGDGQ